LGGDRGFEYTVALTDAIRASTAAVLRTNPEAFRYRGANLRGAVERALYIGLASHTPLMEAYARGGEVPPLGSWMADRTGAALLERPDGPARLDARSLGARLLFTARTAIDRLGADKPPVSGASGGPTCFLIDHPKYLRFIAPARARMTGPSAVVGTDPGDGVDLHVDAWSGPHELEARAVGRALWGFPSLMHAFDRVLRALSELRASRTVVIEGMSPLDEIGSQASAALGIRSICLQQGWSPLIHAGFRGMTHSTMAVWGDGFRELLEPHNPGVEFAVTGNPVLGAELSSGRLCEELGSRRAVAFFLQGTSAWIASEHLLALHDIVLRTAAALPEVTVLVREHPGAPLADEEHATMSAAPNVRMVPAEEFSLREVLDAADLAVSIYSTSLLEGAALGTPALIFNPTSLPPLEPDLQSLGAGERVRDADEAVVAITRIVTDDEHRKRMRTATATVRERYFAGGDAADAALRTAEAIEMRDGVAR
jgi:hypothetical protein